MLNLLMKRKFSPDGQTRIFRRCRLRTCGAVEELERVCRSTLVGQFKCSAPVQVANQPSYAKARQPADRHRRSRTLKREPS